MLSEKPLKICVHFTRSGTGDLKSEGQFVSRQLMESPRRNQAMLSVAGIFQGQSNGDNLYLIVTV